MPQLSFFHRAPAFLFLFLALPAAGWQPERLADLRTTPSPWDGAPDAFVAVGREAYFSTGSELGLWHSDGTAAGTEWLAPIGYPFRLGQVGRRQLFTDGLNFGHQSLWATGGTPDSTERLASDLQKIDVEQAVAQIGDRSVLGITDESNGSEPWVTDGTAAGTHRLADLVPGPAGSDANGFVSWRGRAYFATSSAAGASLWATDGKRTIPIASTPAPRAGTSRAYGLHALPGGMVFFTESRGRGAEIWRSDGTAAGTTRLARLSRLPVPEGGFVRRFRSIEGRLLFLLELSDGVGGGRSELWGTDGSLAGTVRLVDDASFPIYEIGMANRLLFAAYDRAHGSELWGSDGTVAGTRRLADFCPGPCSSPLEATVWIDGRILVVARDLAGDSATLWSLAPAAADPRPTAVYSFPNFRSAAPVGAGTEHATFAVYQTRRSALWSTDGTRAGTLRVAELRGEGYGQSGATLPDGTVLFQGWDAQHGAELWRTDGSPEGTERVVDLAPYDLGGSTPEGLVGGGGLGAFVAQDDADRGLFVTDGTAAGTVRIQLGRGYLGGPFAPRALGSKLCFGLEHRSRVSLWVTDGSRAGTRDLLPAGVSLASHELIQFGGEVYFAASDSEHGRELWASDGTRVGTRRVLDLTPGSANANPRGLVAGASRLWFTAEGTNGRALFVTDGTAAGTHEIPGPRPTLDSSGAERFGRFWYLAEGGDPHRLVLASADSETATQETDLGVVDDFEADPLRAVGDRLFMPFVAVAAGQVSRGLWIVDDTGTHFVAAPVLTGEPAAPTIAFAGRLFFTGNDASFYGRLWSSDGTPEGTGPFLDYQGNSIAAPIGAALIDGRAIFAGNDPTEFNGAFWETDGTPAGTAKIEGAAPLYEQIVFPVPPRLLPWTLVGDRVLYVSWDADHGTEPWVLVPQGGRR